ncbi:MAG: sigma-70 family RNA polymerase sigma factor [Flavobacteriales bacterium]|nr:sigma-70 family RNA polymerase sigma factor [Flavobacteriales bacterium]
MSDADVLHALRNGKAEQAFTRLYKHLGEVSRMVRSHGGSRAEARDLFQDALVILHEKALGTEFTPSGTIAGYLYGVCRNLWLAELRSKGRELHVQKMLGIEPLTEDVDLTAEQEVQRAEQAFEALSEKCRELLTRFYLNRESLSTLAQALGLAGEGAAKTRKYKCLEQARQHYRQFTASTSNA